MRAGVKKAMSLDEALALGSGARTIALGGWGFSHRPCAVAFGLLDTQPSIEELIVLTGGLETDVLVAVGRVRRVRTFYFGLETFGIGPGLRRGVSVVEESETSLLLGLTAATRGVPFLPLAARDAAALCRLRPDLRSIRCPYTGEESVAIPALAPDIAYLHAWRVDYAGNVSLGGHLGADRLLAAASARTVVTCEEMVPALERSGARADIPGSLVDAVVELPGGARPTACAPLYGPDFETVAEYAALEPPDVERWRTGLAGSRAPRWQERGAP